jgi:hypothetical protein
MPSSARKSFFGVRAKARRLLDVSTHKKLRPITYLEMEPALHAALAALVSGWEAYVEKVVLETIASMADPTNVVGSAVTQILLDEARRNSESFNTPNFENSRNFILRFTGYDPYSAMHSSRQQLTVQQTQTRLNEMLKVRHAFAHALQMPNFQWLSRYGLSSRLTKSAVEDCDDVLSDVVTSIDSGLANYLATTFGVTVNW